MLGYLFNWGLLGVLSVQVCESELAYVFSEERHTQRLSQDFYCVAFPGDRRFTKSLVAGVYILELTQTIMLTHDAFGTYAIHFDDIPFLDTIQLLPLSVPIFSGLGSHIPKRFVSFIAAHSIAVSFIVQMYYGYLLRMLSGSRLLGLMVCFVSFALCSKAYFSLKLK